MSENSLIPQVELLSLLELSPHATVILRYTIQHENVDVRLRTVDALSTVNFHEEHTYHALLTVSTFTHRTEYRQVSDRSV